MRIVLLRHGETAYNAADRFQGQADVPLNETGIRQAQEVARSLTPDNWGSVYSSSLSRAAQTAAYAAGRLDVPHLRLDGLRERHLGTLDGLDRTEFAHLHPGALRSLVAAPGYAPPGGESGHAARARFCAALREIAEAGRRGTSRPVLVVTHGGVLNLLARALGGGADAPDGMVGNGRALCLATAWTADGRPRVALRQWDVAPHECEHPPPPFRPLTFVGLDELSADALTTKEVTPT
ncbi:histidine phosphatase family protein [Streptomyces sp. NPDC086554]|uniref:histidine phosphatase family protein n=1 Tax=Streptomyces sp. NPDC086554 TaxID=3154864 RepID=UPI00343E0828